VYNEGKPESPTSPVGIRQVGCVMVPIIGALGGVGIGFIVTDAEAPDTQPVSVLVTKKEVVEFAGTPFNIPCKPVPDTLSPVGTEAIDQLPADGRVK